MDRIQSGKELCDQFFKALIGRDDIDQKVAMLLKELYFESKLTRDNVVQRLKTLRKKRDE